jgi:hypothetical protein
MTTEEFSNEFDTLLDAFGAKSAYGDTGSALHIEVDEYEKSVLLTKAQEEVVINLYSGRNSYGLSFEETEELRRYLESLVKTASPTTTQGDGVSENSVFYQLPSDLWFITYEAAKFGNDATCAANKMALIVPIAQDDFWRVSNNPFRKASQRRVLRLDCGNHKVELVTAYSINKYTVRYMAKPTPIVLENLEPPLSIDGVNTRTECTLNSALHRLILERAVEMATRKHGTMNNQ